MHLLVFGKNGQIGHEVAVLARETMEVTALGSAELDLCDLDALAQGIASIRPDAIINAAAFTDVDRAETERDIAMRVNGDAPGVMAECAHRLGIPLIHFSTDYVFDGAKGAPYVESDPTAPINAYGESKLLGEQRILAAGGTAVILRTSWVYGLRGSNFLTRVLNWARAKSSLRIVEDQTGSPTWARTPAEVAVKLLGADGASQSLAEHAGVYHCASLGAVTRYDWVQRALALDAMAHEHKVGQILPAASDEFETAAERPSFSALDCALLQRTFPISLRSWNHDLELCLAGARDTR